MLGCVVGGKWKNIIQRKEVGSGGLKVWRVKVGLEGVRGRCWRSFSPHRDARLVEERELDAPPVHHGAEGLRLVVLQDLFVGLHAIGRVAVPDVALCVCVGGVCVCVCMRRICVWGQLER
jgi:hypothetical protein